MNPGMKARLSGMMSLAFFGCVGYRHLHGLR